MTRPGNHKLAHHAHLVALLERLRYTQDLGAMQACKAFSLMYELLVVTIQHTISFCLSF